MKQKLVFVADDGREFGSEQECAEYEAQSGFRELVDQFLDSKSNAYKSHAHRSVAKNSIMAFEKFRLAQAK